ncbi:MAG: PilW family protein [Bdellovibrionales bacterium]
MRTQSGATLIELLISQGIAMVVVTALLAVSAIHVNLASVSSSRAQLSVDAMALNDYFSRQLPSAGGEALPIWSAILVEDNNCPARGSLPACNNSDRVTTISAARIDGCSVESSAPGLIRFDQTSGCCLDTIRLNLSHVVLVKVGSVGQRYVTSVNREFCSVSVVNGPAAFNDNVVEPYDWSRAILVPVTIRSYYLDRDTGELIRYTYRSGGPDQNTGILSPLTDRILDFQVALGFDFDPADGAVRDTRDFTDEFLYNAIDSTNGGSLESFGQGQFLNTALNSLRMVQLGLIVGLPTANPEASAPMQILDGPLIAQPTWLLESQLSNFMIRSTRNYE